MDNRAIKILIKFLLLFLVFFAADFAYAGYQTVAPGDTVTLGEFVFDDNFVATTTPCTIGITDPLNVVQVPTTTLMTANADGWHFFDYTVAANAPSGTWRSVMTCGSAANGDLIKADKSFIVATSTLATLQKQWTVNLSDVGEVNDGSDYRTKAWIFNFENAPTDPFATPTITIYRPNRTKAVDGAQMSKLETGIFEFVFSVPSAAPAGTWETEVATRVESTKTIKQSDFWEVEVQAPAQVIIPSMADVTVPSISANVTITNEGTVGFEYQYEWCVVTTQENRCGGGDDVAHAVAAKFIAVGENFNTVLGLTVNNTGTYYFKVVVYWGTERSVASRQFTAEPAPTPPPSPGGGGGGYVAPPSAPVVTPPPTVVLDTPAEGATVSGTVKIAGWALDNDTSIGTFINKVEVFIDGVSQGVATYGLARADVCAIYPARLGCPNVGFEFVWDTTQVAAGPYIIRIEATDSDTSPQRSSISRNVVLSKVAVPKREFSPADLNMDGVVDSTDFSILMFFWKTNPPFANPRADINKDTKVDSIDFSIMLFWWGTRTSAVISSTASPVIAHGARGEIWYISSEKEKLLL